MSHARLNSRGQSGLEAYEVAVEVHLANGLPGFAITGLPAATVRESKDRVRAALQTNHLHVPQRRITVHLGPADVPKDGGRFDLAIALGLVKADTHARWATDGIEFVGELALDGQLRPVRGVLPAALAARRAGRSLVIPKANAAEAGLAEHARVFAANHLLEVIAHLEGGRALERVRPTPLPEGRTPGPDLADVRGQSAAKRALVVAAAGSHNLLLIGPPGSGKSMLAERLRGLLPPLPKIERLRVASIASLAGKPVAPLGADPPFRAPHHSTPAQALIGGGTRPTPGEISLAHRGVLFLDELPEFSRAALEALREPLQTGVVRISRVREQVAYPADFQLIAAMNPCPCGYLGDGTDRCRCGAPLVQQYRNRLSGPLLDRFDLHVPVPRVEFQALAGPADGQQSAAAAHAIAQARQRQLSRHGVLNARLPEASFWTDMDLEAGVRDLLEQAAAHWRLSARGTVRVLKVARTIADLDGARQIGAPHMAEALQLRCLDRPA